MPKKADSTVDSTVMTMALMLKEQGGQAVPFVPGSVVEGTVISSSSTRVWVDIHGVAVGVIPERELSVMSTELKPGDPVVASVLVLEDKKGNTILSLRRADRERIANELNARAKDGQPTPIRISDANKGGLLVEMGDFTGFLPVSQLASEHYPRVDGGNPDEILAKLKELIGQTLMGKLIFSEKAAGDSAQEEKLKNIKEGDTLEGTITGIVDFGIFVRLGRDDSALEGLVHISEIAWGRVTDIASMYEVGQSVKVLVVSTADNRVSLSIKRLLPDPWQEAASKYKVGDVVEGQVTRSTQFGTFVRLDSEIDGLVHISEISSERITDPATILKPGENFQFKIISIDAGQHRLGLSYKRVNEPETDVEAVEGDEPKKPAKKSRKKLVDEAVTAPMTEEAVEAAPEVAEQSEVAAPVATSDEAIVTETAA
jgi:small subunit ribosomal protein S1